MQQFFWKFAGLLALSLLIGCRRPAPAAAQDAETPTPSLFGNVPHDRVIEDTARFLAGMPGDPGGPFTELEGTEGWQEHRRRMDAAWALADDKLIRGLREFQQTELSGAPMNRLNLFYPFSGPDALTATICFPQSPTYLLAALEPAGTMPSPRKLQKKELAQYLAEVRTTMASELGKSFFVTREMDRQFRGQVTDGLLVPVALLLVRTGHTILGLKHVRLDEQGQIVERPEGGHVDAEFANKGFVIEFRTNDDHSTHQLCYIRVDLSNKHLHGNAGFLHYVNAMPAPVTLLKATSYMTHHADFSLIRDLIVNRSEAVFQDDSGIPFHLFTPAQWTIQLYGDYTRPYGSFRWLEQADLRQAYVTGTVKPLSLRLGYGFGKVTSNLLLAKRIH